MAFKEPESSLSLLHKSPLVPIFSKVHPVPSITIYLLQIHFNIILSSASRPSIFKWKVSFLIDTQLYETAHIICSYEALAHTGHSTCWEINQLFENLFIYIKCVSLLKQQFFLYGGDQFRHHYCHLQAILKLKINNQTLFIYRGTYCKKSYVLILLISIIHILFTLILFYLILDFEYLFCIPQCII